MGVLFLYSEEVREERKKRLDDCFSSLSLAYIPISDDQIVKSKLLFKDFAYLFWLIR